MISDEVYQKIRLDRSDYISVKEEENGDKPDEIKASHILISYKGADRADSDISRSKDEAKKKQGTP